MTNEQRAEEIQNGRNKQEHLERLYYDNLGLWRVALRPFRGLCDWEELEQQAFLSVAEAAKRYESGRGSFASFACLLIRQDIPVYLASCGTISFPAWMGKRKREYKKLLSDGVTNEREQAERLGVSVEEVRLLSLSVVSMSNETEAGELGECIASGEDLEAEAVEKIGAEELRAFVWQEVGERLDGRRFEIVQALFMNGESVASLADRFGVSVTRIGQIKQSALDRLRKSEKLERIARDYDLITVYAWRGGLNRWKQTGTSCVEKYVLECERLDRKRRRLVVQMLVK